MEKNSTLSGDIIWSTLALSTPPPQFVFIPRDLPVLRLLLLWFYPANKATLAQGGTLYSGLASYNQNGILLRSEFWWRGGQKINTHTHTHTHTNLLILWSLKVLNPCPLLILWRTSSVYSVEVGDISTKSPRPLPSPSAFPTSLSCWFVQEFSEYYPPSVVVDDCTTHHVSFS